MKRTIFITLAIIAAFAASCGGSANWTERGYDLAAGTGFDQFLQDMAALSAVPFTVDPELQEALDASPPELPALQGLSAGEVLSIVQDTMPPQTAFVYERSSGGGYWLRLRFEQAEDLTGADPAAFESFAGDLGFSGAALISDPQFDEICGGPVSGTILDLLGDGGSFAEAYDVVSDPSGHSEFIGAFPPALDAAIDGHTLTVTGEAPWVAVSGSIEDDGSFDCAGSGVVAGFPNVTVQFAGTAAPEGLAGTLTVGAGGELPGGQPAVYAVHP